MVLEVVVRGPLRRAQTVLAALLVQLYQQGLNGLQASAVERTIPCKYESTCMPLHSN